jgi:hypothetical protein
MQNHFPELQHFVKAVTGRWYNPESKNEYVFTPGSHSGFEGEVTILQAGAETAIP